MIDFLLLIHVIFLNTILPDSQTTEQNLNFKFQHPTIVKQAQTPQTFIPPNYTRLKTLASDLNADDHKDWIAILQADKKLQKSDFNYPDEYDENAQNQPRILLIALYNPKTRNYELIHQNPNIIPPSTSTFRSDPYKDLLINNGNICIEYELFSFAGSWTTSHDQHCFHLFKNNFYLITRNYRELQRNTGNTTEEFTEFLLHRKKITQYDWTQDNESQLPNDIKPTYHALKQTKIQSLDSLQSPL